MTDAPDGAPIPLLKDRKLEFAGRQWTLRLAMLGFITLKEHWGIEDDAPLIKRIARENITDAPALLWSAMQAHHPETTYAQVVAWCDEASAENLQAAIKVAKDAMMAGWGAPEKKPPAATAKTKGSSA